MLLYNKKKNSIDIFSFDYNNNDMICFKKKEIEQIPYQDRILSSIRKELVFDKDKRDKIILPTKDNKNIEYYTAKSQKNEINRNFLLNGYYSGVFDDWGTITSFDLKKLKYYIMNLDIKNLSSKNVVGNIIQVPEILFNLQLLLKGQFKSLKDVNIDEILDLFMLEKIDEVDLSKVYGRHSIIRKGNLDDALKKANNDRIILKKLTRK